MSDIDIPFDKREIDDNAIAVDLPAPNAMVDHLSNFLNDTDNIFWAPSKVAQKAKNDPRVRLHDPKILRNAINRHHDYTAQRHRPLDKKYKKKRYKKTNAYTIGFLQMDIANLQSITDPTQSNKYLLVIIDIFSRKLYLYPLEDREMDFIIIVLEDSFLEDWNRDNNIPQNWNIDENFDHIPSPKKGYDVSITHELNLRRVKSFTFDREFNTEPMKHMLGKHSIATYSPQPNDKGATSLVERAIQQVRNMLGRWMTKTGRSDWIHILTQLTNSYNNTKHSSIGVTPNWAAKHIDKFSTLDKFEKNEMKKWKQDKKENFKPTKKPEYINVNDLVRINEHPTTFHRKIHRAVWSHQIYKVVTKVRNRFKVRPVDHTGAFVGPIKKRKRKNIEGTDASVDLNTDEEELFAPYNLLKINNIPQNIPNNDTWSNIREINNERRVNRAMADLDMDIAPLDEVENLPDVRQSRNNRVDRLDTSHQLQLGTERMARDRIARDKKENKRIQRIQKRQTRAEQDAGSSDVGTNYHDTSSASVDLRSEPPAPVPAPTLAGALGASFPNTLQNNNVFSNDNGEFENELLAGQDENTQLATLFSPNVDASDLMNNNNNIM